MALPTFLIRRLETVLNVADAEAREPFSEVFSCSHAGTAVGSQAQEEHFLVAGSIYFSNEAGVLFVR